MKASLNLARRPFVNVRPVLRFTLLMWILGAVSASAAGFLYWSFFQGQGENRAELDRINAEIRQEQAAITELEGGLRQIDVAQENEQIAFLNQKIEERTFGWSLLFDLLADILPRDVRLLSLAPESRRSDDRGSRRAAARDDSEPGELLKVVAEARNEEAILELVDAFFESPAFRSPNLIQETRGASGVIQFNLEVRYLPDQAVILEPADAEAAVEELEDEPSATGQEDGEKPAEETS